MASRCEICGKAPMTGYAVSHAHNRTKKRQRPNLIRTLIRIEGGNRRIKICSRCLRSGRVAKA